MPYYPPNASGLGYATYPAGPTAAGATLTAAGSTNTKGAYTELISSTPFECNEVHLDVLAADAIGGRLYLIDIAVGPAGSEVVKIPNILSFSESATAAAYSAGSYSFRLRIPSGSRVAARVQCSTASGTIVVALTLVKAGTVAGCAEYQAYGINTSTSIGTTVDPGGTANTKGSFTEISSGVDRDLQDITLVAIRPNGTVGNSGGSMYWAVDIATGPAGSETVLVPDLRFQNASRSGSESKLSPRSYRLPIFIASGTRVAIRASCNDTTSPNRTRGFALYGATAPAESQAGEHAFVFA